MSASPATRLAHIVFFTLAEPTDSAIDALITDCHEYLDGHPGTVHYSAGRRGEEFTRPVNDSQYHVGLHVVFESKQAHDTYQESARHQEFLARNKPTWADIRVFDSYV